MVGEPLYPWAKNCDCCHEPLVWISYDEEKKEHKHYCPTCEEFSYTKSEEE